MNESQIMKALFAQQRIQVMHIAKHHDEFTDSYLYAWESGVYPFLNDTDGSVPGMPHESYEEFFKISRKKGEYLLKRLDDAWLAKEELTFYKLEDELEVRSGYGGDWDRSDLLHLCRYFYLDNRFDDSLWKNVCKNMECPAEAHFITDKFDRTKDIFFM
ncbi:hypothetical protein G5574_12475 [Pantoea stewartii]|uniref:hypothetical protein n=1 Tax=Pantoea stewartii TaxID=66269 RepID=UPI0013DD9926|nr:hypothetical protein [Pantoea stewartii]QIE97727.1 hypothetical protein G5574_12475 [Pantoea stewartii]